MMAVVASFAKIPLRDFISSLLTLSLGISSAYGLVLAQTNKCRSSEIQFYKFHTGMPTDITSHDGFR